MRRVALALLLLAACRERDTPATATASGSSAAPAARALYPAAPGSFVDLVAGARHGVVAIRAATPVRSGPAAMFPGAPDAAADVALGTGFLVEAHGPYVITNDHIAAAATDLHVVLADGTEVPAKLVGRDPRLDIAMLSIDPASASPRSRVQALPLGDSDQLAVGEWIVALGDAFGEEVTASAGIVSATGAGADGSLVPGRTMGYRTFLQTDARIHRGNSGGPVLDTAGMVVGVAVAPSDRPGELSFVVPINRVREVLDAMRDTGLVARSWLGVLVKPVTPDLAASAGLAKPAGALVTELKAGSPAARSSLRAGDIVLRWADRDVDHRTLPWAVAATPPGKAVTVTVWRDRAEVSLPVMTERMPE